MVLEIRHPAESFDSQTADTHCADAANSLLTSNYYASIVRRPSNLTAVMGDETHGDRQEIR